MSVRLGEGDGAAHRSPKVRALHEAARRGLRVPEGIVLDRPLLADGDGSAVLALLEAGPVIVRSAHADEDGEEQSLAGLGLSVAGCRDLAAVQNALARIASGRLPAGSPALPSPQVLVQREVDRRWLVVAVWTEAGGWYAEAHDRPGEVLAAGDTPRFAGPLAEWDDPAQAAVASLCAALPDRLRGRHGLDLEVVVDPGGGAWLVQARPLSRPLHPDWPAFEAALRRQEAIEGLPSVAGLLTLDAEHNPAPLSPAHQWLMGHLRRQRPGAGDPTVLAGFLYVRALPRALANAPVPGAARRALVELATVHLPRARARLLSFEEELAAAARDAIPLALARALEAFLAMIDVYLREIVPARAGAAPLADPSDPLCLRGRGEFLDVLPVAWDIASPCLSAVVPPEEPPDATPALPVDEPSAATLLAEWDDHLFALGLAPLRLVYLRAGTLLGVGERVFSLTAEELRALAEGSAGFDLATTLDERERESRARAQLRPPLRLWNGRPLPLGGGTRLRGVPVGEPCCGPIQHRADLAGLLADPPPPGAIACLPALTAPAAVALRTLGVRAVCTEYGGALSHGTLMARELGLSALLGCRGVLEVPAGSVVWLDTRAGRLRVLPRGVR